MKRSILAYFGFELLLVLRLILELQDRPLSPVCDCLFNTSVSLGRRLHPQHGDQRRTSCRATRRSLALCQCELCQVNPSNSFLSHVFLPRLISYLSAVWCRLQVVWLNILYAFLVFCARVSFVSGLRISAEIFYRFHIDVLCNI